jgi:23S rRNA pseudouridine2605 synthase
VPEWAKAPMAAKRRKAAKGGGKRERLQKVMAQSGYGSRRNIEILIAQGHLTINGQPAKLGDQVGPGDKVKLDGKLIRLRFGEPLPRVLMYHKPTGEIVTRDDPEGRPTVFEKLPKVNGGRWLSIGRLDFNTEGLLLFTTNGELVEKMSHPRFEVEREYAVRVMGELTEETREKLLKTGVDIDGEMATFDSIEDRGGEGSNHWYHVVLREGKNREVRRMFEAVGLMVSRLMRVRFGNVALPGHIKRGQMREMDEDQVHELMAFAGMNETAAGEDDEEDAVEDEFDNIGNRVDPRELAAEEREDHIDDDVGNRWQPTHQRAEEHEPDGNRGTYVPGGGDTPPRHPKAHGGKTHHVQGHGSRRPHGPPGQPGQKKFFKKRGPQGEGPNGNVAPHAPRHAFAADGGNPQGQGPGPKQGFRHGKRRKNRGGQPGQGPAQGGAQQHAQGQGQQGQAGNGPPQGGQAHGPAQPGQGKPGRHRRKNRNRGGGGGPRGAEGHQPANSGGSEPV